MIKKQIIFPSLDGGLNSAVSSVLIGDNESALAENVEYISGKVRKRPGTSDAITTLSSPVSVVARRAYNYKMTDGTEKILVYERGTTATKQIYQSTGGTWTWATMTKNWGTPSGETLVLTNPNKPTFITVRGKCLFSQGDTALGLMYYSGSGDAYRTMDEGNKYYTASGRFAVFYKERLILANGYYYDTQNLASPYWCASRKPSAMFISSLYDSSGAEVDPYQSDAWWENWKYYRTISEDDGGEIVAMWLMHDAIYVGKTTGIWRVFFNDISKLYIDQVTNVPMETQDSLQMFPAMNGCIFRNYNHVYFFNGRDEPKPIDEPIKNYINKIPNFDIGGEGDSDDITLDSKTQWEAANDDGAGATTNIDFGDSGYIEVDTEAFNSYSQTSIDAELTYGTSSTITKVGWRFSPSDFFKLTTVKLKMRKVNETGTFDVSVFSGGDSGLVEEEITTPITTDVSTLSGTATVETFDFTDQAETLDKNMPYWVVVSWNGSGAEFAISHLAGSWASYTNALYIVGQWNHYKNQKAYLVVAGAKYYTSGDYHTLNSGAGSLGFDITPDTWGQFIATDTGEVERIVYKMRSSANQSSWTGWETLISGDTPTITCQKYIDFHVELTSSTGSHSSPRVLSISIMGFKDTGEETDRFMCSTIFNNRYRLSTNINTDGVYRTFVLDKNGKWGIDPDQLVIDYFDYNFEKYLVTVDTNTKIHKMYKGEESVEYNYDYSCITPTKTTALPNGTARYLMTIRTKKFDCGMPGFLKLMKELKISMGTLFSSNFLQGTMKYRLDNDDWTEVHFQDENSAGDSAIRHIFPSGQRGKYIQFQFETYFQSGDYGTPYYVKDIVLDYFIQKMALLSDTQTTILDDVGGMVE